MKRSGKRGESKSRSVLCKYRGAIRSWVAAGSPLSAASPGAGCCCQNLSHCFSAPYAFASLRRGQRPARPRPLDVVAGNPKPRAGLLRLAPSGEVDRKPCTVRCGSCRPRGASTWCCWSKWCQPRGRGKCISIQNLSVTTNWGRSHGEGPTSSPCLRRADTVVVYMCLLAARRWSGL
jgi:hypothetical protein